MRSPAWRACEHLVRHALRGIWLRGELHGGPLVLAANHHSWWDPFLAAAFLARHRRTQALLMDQENLRRFRVARLLGAFGTAELRHGLAALHRGDVLVVFPEGQLRPPGQPGVLAGGAAWYARRARVPLCVAATRVVVRGHQFPEAYLWLSEVDVGGGLAEVTERLRHRLAEQLDELDREITGGDPRTPLPGFSQVLRGRRSWDERWPHR